MKIRGTLLLLILSASVLYISAQESLVTIGGGYAFATIQDYDDAASGFRINGLYEFNPTEGMLVHGIAVGYVNISSTKLYLDRDLTTTVVTVPIYYAPKLLFGGEKAKVYVKGAVGMQFASLRREGGITDFSDNDAGFYGGGGAGGMLFLTKSIFINVEYEIAWAKNNFYGDGWLNSVMGGVGIKF
jgi:hypothetical protein